MNAKIHNDYGVHGTRTVDMETPMPGQKIYFNDTNIKISGYYIWNMKKMSYRTDRVGHNNVQIERDSYLPSITICIKRNKTSITDYVNFIEKNVRHNTICVFYL